jgi:hypothetical protein
MTEQAEIPVRLTRTYATGADVRRELTRVIADATAYRTEFERLREAFDAQAAWSASLEADARRMRDRNRLQRAIGKLFRM